MAQCAKASIVMLIGGDNLVKLKKTAETFFGVDKLR